MDKIAGQLKDGLPLLTIIATVAFAWGSLNAQLIALNNKVDTIVETSKEAANAALSLQDEVQANSLKIEHLQTIIDDAQRRGLLSYSSTSKTPSQATLASVTQPLSAGSTTGTSSGSNDKTTVVIISPQPTAVPAPTAKPTSAPQPTGTPVIAICVLQLCL